MESKNIGESIVEKDIHRTNLKRILHVLFLVIPVVAAFGGNFFAGFLWNHFASENANGTSQEIFRFFVTVIFFFIPSFLIFLLTRNENPIIKIKIHSK